MHLHPLLVHSANCLDCSTKGTACTEISGSANPFVSGLAASDHLAYFLKLDSLFYMGKINSYTFNEIVGQSKHQLCHQLRSFVQSSVTGMILRILLKACISLP